MCEEMCNDSPSFLLCNHFFLSITQHSPSLSGILSVRMVHHRQMRCTLVTVSQSLLQLHHPPIHLQFADLGVKLGTA